MANVKANLASNYKSDGSFKDLLFYRNSEYFNPKTIEVEIDKSPFYKQALVKVNSDLKTFPKFHPVLPKNLQIYSATTTPPT
jgi:hypothetical protein